MPSIILVEIFTKAILSGANKKQTAAQTATFGCRHCRLVRETGLGLVAATQSRVLISALLRSSVFRGSDNTLCCHSLPLPFKPRFLKIRKNNRRHIEICRLLFWCEKRDLNPYGVTTRPSNVRVCQFRHSRI